MLPFPNQTRILICQAPLGDDEQPGSNGHRERPYDAALENRITLSPDSARLAASVQDALAADARATLIDGTVRAHTSRNCSPRFPPSSRPRAC
jgi:hypothetical protein